MKIEQRIHSEYLNLIQQLRLNLKPALIQISSSQTYWGQWNSENRTLQLSKKLIDNENWYHLTGVLKHEMAHQIVSEIFKSQDLHGPDFQKACVMIGVPSEFRHAKVDLQDTDLDWQKFYLNQESQAKISKVEKLLALTASDNPHEAKLALLKAQKMGASTSNQQSESAQYFQKTLLSRKGSISSFEKEVLHFLTEHYSVFGLIGHTYDIKTSTPFRTLEIIGLPENIMIAEFVFQFLNRAVTENTKKGMHKKSFQSGFLSGFKTQYQNEELLALVPIDPELKNYASQVYPQLRTRRISAPSLDSESYAKGFEIGKKTQIRQPLTAKKSTDTLIKRLGSKFC